MKGKDGKGNEGKEKEGKGRKKIHRGRKECVKDGMKGRIVVE